MNRNPADDRSDDRNSHRLNGLTRRAATAIESHSVPGFLEYVGPDVLATPSEEVQRQSVHWNEAESRFLMEDDRIVTHGNRAFCFKLIDVLIQAGKARAAHLGFSRHRLAVEFADRSTSRPEAARVLGESIRLASIPVNLGERFETVPVQQNWDAFAFFADADRHPTVWWWIEPENGQARLHGNGLKMHDADPRSWSQLIPGVRSSRRDRLSKGVHLQFDQDRADLWNIIASIDEICRFIHARNEVRASQATFSLSTASRFVHLGMAAGSMARAVVGILIPGVPTVPFVLLTSYRLAKSPHRILASFRRTPLFGTIGEDWERGRFIRTNNKIWMISISTGVLILSLMSITQMGIMALLTIGTVYTLTAASVLAMPGSPQRYEMPHITPSRKPGMLPG